VQRVAPAGRKPDFWPVSKFNTVSLPLCSIPAGNKLETRALQSTFGPVTEVVYSVQIDALIGVAILPQTSTKLNKKRGYKFGALLWRHLTPERKTET